MTPPSPTAKVLVWNYLALMTLLALTAAASQVPLGEIKGAVSLVIAATKMALVFLFFMQLWYRRGLIRLFAATGFMWLCIIGTLLFCDYATRGWFGG